MFIGFEFVEEDWIEIEIEIEIERDKDFVEFKKDE